jgi:LemA protein
MNSESQYKPKSPFDQPHSDIDVQRIKKEGRFSDEEVSQIYERAAKIQSDAFFLNDTGLTDEEMERGANRAGISDAALMQAIKEREQERKKAEETAKQRVTQKATLTKRLLIGGGVFVALAGINLLTAQSALGSRAAKVEAASAQIENVLERRHNLIPNLISVTKSTLDNQSALIQNLNTASEAARRAPAGAKAEAEAELGESISQTLEQLRREQGSSPAVLRLSDEWAGAENRIAVERRKYNTAAAEYNRAASSFPTSLARPLLGYPAQYKLFQASAGAKEAPKF